MNQKLDSVAHWLAKLLFPRIFAGLKLRLLWILVGIGVLDTGLRAIFDWSRETGVVLDVNFEGIPDGVMIASLVTVSWFLLADLILQLRQWRLRHDLLALASNSETPVELREKILESLLQGDNGDN